MWNAFKRQGWRETSISPAWHQVFSITQLDEADATMLRLCQSQQYRRAAKCLCMAASAVCIFDRDDFAKRIFRHVATDDDASRSGRIDFRNCLLLSRSFASFACKDYELLILIETKHVLASGDASTRTKNYRETMVILLSKIMDDGVTFGNSRERQARTKNISRAKNLLLFLKLNLYLEFHDVR